MDMSNEIVIALVTGIVLGASLAAAYFSSKKQQPQQHESARTKADSTRSASISDSDDGDDDDDEDEEGNESYKMVLVVNNSLKMQKGKIAAQCCHGCLGAYKKAKRDFPDVLRVWSSQGQPKITLKGKDEDELRTVSYTFIVVSQSFAVPRLTDNHTQRC